MGWRRMKQTGLFRSITEVRANCEQSGKTGADRAQRKTMPTVTYILSGREGGYRAGSGECTAQHEEGFECFSPSRSLGQGQPSYWAPPLQPAHVRTSRDTWAKWCRDTIPLWCVALQELHNLLPEPQGRPGNNSPPLPMQNSPGVKMVPFVHSGLCCQREDCEGQSVA